MKRKSTFVLLCVAMCFVAQAKIWRVNNISGVQADFTTLQAAHDAASSGDTLHVEGSPNQYQGITLTKKLTILGPGYFLAENPNTQSLLQTAWVSSMNFNVGSEGSSVTGLDFRNGALTVQADDIFIRRNNFALAGNGVPDWQTGIIRLYYHSNNSNNPVNNVLITQNFGVAISINNSSSSILITGNYLATNGYQGEDNTSQALQMHNNASAIIQNNIFRRGTIEANNSSITNNILYKGLFTGNGNLVSNNLCSGTQFPSGNSNKQNVDMSTVFVGAGTDISTDGQWKLKAGSPAIGAGYGSTNAKKIDAGMFGGNTPYVLSGMPSMPAIYFFENQPVGSNSDPIDVSIKVRSAGN